MKKLLATLAAFAVMGSALCAPIPAAAAEKTPVDVYILAGQSNAVGYSNLSQAVKGQDNASYTYRDYIGGLDERNKNGYSEVLYYGAIELRADRAFPNYSIQNVRMGLGNGVNFMGPELGMAQEFSKTYSASSPAAILKCAVGGTYLGDWSGEGQTSKDFGSWGSPSLLAEWRESGKTLHQYAGKLYERLLETVTHGLAALKSEGYEPRIVGYLWMQGEADIEREYWYNAYEHNLTLFINDLRAAVAEIAQDEEAGAMPFVIGKIAYDFANRWAATGVDTVRAAEDAVAAKVPNVYTVETDDLHIGGGNGSDDYHFNPKDMYELGQRFAKTASENIAKYTYSVRAGIGGSALRATLHSDGEPFTVPFEPNRGKIIDKVLLNGTDVTAEVLADGVITVTPAAGAAAFNTIELTFKDATKYTLTMNPSLGGRVTGRSISGNTVYPGEELSFRLSPDEGFAVDKVLVNGVEISANGEGKYVVPIEAKNYTIDITFTRLSGDPSTGGNGSAASPSDGGLGGLEIGLIAGAGVVAVAAVTAVAVVCTKKKKNKNK